MLTSYPVCHTMQTSRSARTVIVVTLASLALMTAGTALARPEPAVKAPQVDNPVRLLMVGNSYLYYGDSLHTHLNGIVSAADPAPGKQLQYKSATIGGASLDHHNFDWLTKPGQIGVKEPFQLVVLQGNSAAALSESRQAVFRKAATEANKLITERGGKTALYMPHAYVAPHKQAKPENIRLNEAFYVAVGNELNALVIPVGLAFEEAYRRFPDMKLHKAHDGSHPSLLGTYLAAATCYATLYGKSPVGNSFNAFGQIDAESLKKVQQVAEDTVKTFFGR